MTKLSRRICAFSTAGHTSGITNMKSPPKAVMKSLRKAVMKSPRKAVKAAILCVLGVVFLAGSKLEISQIRRGLAEYHLMLSGGVPSFLALSGPPFQAFNQTNPHEHSWCPSASCHNSPMCSPCNRRYLFIAATGRSASTTLLKMLNYLPNVRLSGENNNELYVASLLDSNLRKSSSSMAYDEEVVGAWMHHKIPNQAMACPIQHVVSTITPPPNEVLQTLNETWAPSLDEYDQSTILGLKTIRIQQSEWSPSEWSPSEAAAFFKESFPCSRIVVNIRSDTGRQAQSAVKLGWTPRTPDAVEEGLMKEVEFLTEFAEHLGPDTARIIDMEMWTQHVSILNDLVAWLGYKDCNFQSIVHDNHHGYGLDLRTDPKIGDKCHYPQ